MTFGSLFSGIGGLDLGLERAGMSCIWQCEIDSFCRKVLAKHWPGVKCYEDVRKIDETAPAIDLLCGGFPCQPHSVAGKRKGADDERNLWPECIRLVRLLRPRWCLFENVPGLLTTMFGPVCDELRGASYEVWPLVLGADDVRAPHRRKRVWIMAHANGCGRRASRITKSKSFNAEQGSSVVAIPRHERLERIGPLDSRPHATTEASGTMACQFCGYRGLETRWPSRPGEPQHDWEAPRLIRAGHGQRNERNEGDQRSDGNTGTEAQLCGQIESGVGESTHGLSRRLARLRREQLKALGNAVVPQCAEVIGRAIMQASHDHT